MRVRDFRAIVCLSCVLAYPAQAAIVWDGPDVTFTKASNDDWNQAQNQDRLTDSVWITRASSQGIFNIKQEGAYTHHLSPAGTEWADGLASDWQSLAFTDWESWAGNDPPATVGRDAVVHLIADDIYLNVRFLSWDSGHGTGGGGFSYVRSTAVVPEPLSALTWFGIAGAGSLLRRRRERSPLA